MAIKFLNTVAVDTDVLYVDATNNRVGIGINNPGNKLDVDGITTSLGFRTPAATTDYSLISRESAGNSPLYVQSANTSANQTLAKFNYGSTIANGGTNVLTVAKDNSYFINTNLGIGTTNPAAKLDVAGNIKVSGSTAMFSGGVKVLDIFSAGSNAYINTGTSGGTLRFGAPAQNVTNVNVQGLLSAEDINISGGDGYLINGMGFAIESSSVLTLGDWDSNDFATRIMDNNATEVLRVTDGNVGIGTTNPSSKLNVQSAMGTAGQFSGAQLRLDTSNLVDNTGFQGISFSTSTAANNGWSMGANRSTGGRGSFRIYEHIGSATGNERLTLLQGGNVGIGTTSPSSKLDVNGRVRIGDVNYTYAGSNYHILLAEDSNDAYISNIEGYGILSAGGYYYGGNLRKLNSTSTAYSGIQARPDGTILFENATGGTAGSTIAATEKMRIKTNGNVGIGITNPAYALDVNGRIKSSGEGLQIAGYGSDIRLRAYYSALNFSSMLYVGGVNGYSYQPVYASAFNVSSDYRLKTNVVDLEEAIERIKQINVHRFNWKDRLDEEKVDGFLAHELAEVIPEAVTGEKDAVREDGTLDYQGVDQAKVVPLLTAALQEAILKIEQLETRIQTLENN